MRRTALPAQRRCCAGRSGDVAALHSGERAALRVALVTVLTGCPAIEVWARYLGLLGG
jgi:hypothetical protein